MVQLTRADVTGSLRGAGIATARQVYNGLVNMNDWADARPTMPIATSPHEKVYSEPRFWRKATRHASSAGRQVLEKALWLYYAVQNPATPKWARRVIYGALGYFVLPLDAIPDLAPLVGYTDDLTVMSAALATVAFYINDDVKQLASHKLQDWFGNAPSRSDHAG